MSSAPKIGFIDISVFNRGIRSIAEEVDFTSHSLGYLAHLAPEIAPIVIRFGKARDVDGIFHLYRYTFANTLRVIRLIRSKKPALALFHGFSFPLRFFFLHLCCGSNVSWAIQHHAGGPSKNVFKRIIQRLAYSRAQAVLFVSRVQAQSFIDAGIVADERRVHEVMECSTGFRMLEKTEARRELGLDPDLKTFIWVGNLNPNKDPFCLLHAIAKLRQFDPNFVLYMFFRSGEFADGVADFVMLHDLTAHIKRMGSVQNKELEKWFNASDYFVSCSHDEGSGVALAEAMACGCIPIATKIPSFIGMTAKAAAGHLFDVGNSDELFNILHALPRPDASDRLVIRRQFDAQLSFEAIGREFSRLALSSQKRL